MDPYIGKLLDNRYEILELVGAGGMARVYKARCHRLNRLVAIKILREDLAQDAELRRRFHDESQAVAMLSHPNIVAVYDVSRSSDLEYIVMELIDGITLKQYMQRKGNKLNWREALHFITQIVKALGHAHSRGIIHRDIKPHNVMVLRDGSVKVADFGIARLTSGGHSTLTQEALGSVHYISPEQARGSRIDARSDLYSAGVVLYEMITGRLPFEGDTPVSVAIQHINSIPLSPREIDPDIPEALEAITMKAMAPDPDDRYANADEMLADLEEFRKNPNINFDYTPTTILPEEELDSDKTQIRSLTDNPTTHSGETEERNRRSFYKRRIERQDEGEEENPQEGRNSPWPIITAVAVVLLFIFAVFYFLYRTVFSGFFDTPSKNERVPNLLGSVYEEIVDDSDLLGGLTVVIGDRVADENAKEGVIINQDPKPNTVLKEGTTEITVVVSSGQDDPVVMVDVFDMEFTEAYLKLEELGLKPEMDYAYHDTIEENHVISFTPLKDELVPVGSQVHLIISLGPEMETFKLPSFENMTKEEAESNIHLLNLEVIYVEPVFSDTVPENSIVSQNPAAETEVTEGDTIRLQLSKGKDPDKEKPDLPAESSKMIDISLSDYTGVVNLTVMADGKVIHEKDHDASVEKSVPITIAAPKGSTSTVTCFINGHLVNSFKVEIQ